MFMMHLSSSVAQLIVLENFNTIISSNNNGNNLSIPFVIDNCTMDSKLGGFEIDIRFHIPHYDSIINMPNYYSVSIENIIETTPLSNKIEITFMTDEILVVPKVDYQPHGYYHIQALLVEEGLYKMYIRLECGSVDYMTITHDKLISDELKAFYLESRRIVNDFEILIVNNDSLRLNKSTNTKYCSSTQAFNGRFHIGNNFNYYDTDQHDGDVDFTFQPYGCKLRDTSKSTELLDLLSNQHIIFLSDSTIEAVYRCRWTRVSKRWFDLDKSMSIVRLSSIFDGAPCIIDDLRGGLHYTIIIWLGIL